ncbi:tRNA preQ1(34) S-adenosylmethionine ribosyltransferase-isomerase QueA [Candidatus Poriferisodalis sp.]|uniref:tRNA preQ1(34) S-adenosylmethionine ribosyltransferase-isomerase QueA n=1 Tax=Candidatus Poriferisodalis sp. TaxID=3101277 RepID=UPI003C6F0DBB
MDSQRLLMGEFEYDLPSSAIAQVPAEPRDSARLLADRGPCIPPEHRHISDLPSLLGSGDVLVVNETRVMPARLPLRKRTGGVAEVLLLEPLTSEMQAAGEDAGGDAREVGHGAWAALVRPSRRIADGTVLVSERDPNVQVIVRQRLDRQRRAVDVLVDGVPLVDVSQAPLLERAGEAPLPPYIDPNTARSAIAERIGVDAADSHAARAALADRYQTVYARTDGSAAAPTAGLHLTERVLHALRSNGVEIATVDLTVGLATFAPVTAEHADEHEMHVEHYRVPAATLAACDAAERVVAVGTTTVRALESAALARQPVAETGTSDICGWTELFLRRGAEFLVVDGLLTNFHLPRSSLLLLIDAFIGPHWRDLYETALANGYRFLSFGDAMLLQRSSGQ